MLYQKASPKGIDIHILALQRLIYPALKTAWSIDNDTAFDCHGRAYRNQTEDGYIPEVYKGDQEYKEVLFDDTLSALCFFGVGEEVRFKNVATAPVFLIFMVDLSKIKPGDDRNDEEARLDVQKLFTPGRSGVELTGFNTGIDTVFREYSGYRKAQGMKYRDMHPKHCFRLNFSLTYDINQCFIS